MKWLGVLAVAVLAACGGSASPASTAVPNGATNVSPQSGEIPNGMYRCPETGDTVSFLAAEKASGNFNYTADLRTWNTAKNAGAVAGQVTEYSDSNGECTLITKDASNIGAHPFLASWVVQFKDAQSAAAAYDKGSVSGLNRSSFEGQTPGAATGLGTNAIAASNPDSYLALWQRGPFLASIFVLNMSSQTGHRIALTMYSRMTT